MVDLHCLDVEGKFAMENDFEGFRRKEEKIRVFCVVDSGEIVKFEMDNRYLGISLVLDLRKLRR